MTNEACREVAKECDRESFARETARSSHSGDEQETLPAANMGLFGRGFPIHTECFQGW